MPQPHEVSRIKPGNKVEYVRFATAEDLKKIVLAFNRLDVKYILVGGYALQILGHARTTQDIDFLLQPTKEQGKKVIDALTVLADSEAKNIDLAWFEEGEGITLLDEIQVDLLFRTSGGTYQDLEPYIHTVELDGVPVTTLTIEGLLLTKKTYREKDIPDRLFLEKALHYESCGKAKNTHWFGDILEAIGRIFKRQ